MTFEIGDTLICVKSSKNCTNSAARADLRVGNKYVIRAFTENSKERVYLEGCNCHYEIETYFVKPVDPGEVEHAIANLRRIHLSVTS